ncbi:hypothetical protein V8D89_003119 [Ganoderma adspersum]
MIIPPPDSWTTSFILGLSCIVILVFSAISSAIFLIYIRIRARKTARFHGPATTSKAVDQENKVEPDAPPYNHVPVNQSATWSALKAPQPDVGLRPLEPQLSWPVLSVLPSLRPKDPVHVRMKNAVVGWNKEAVKYEPFTVADVMRAMEEASVQGEMQGTTPVLPNPERAHGPNTAGPFSRAMPEIVVHPADGKPSFSPALEEWSVTAMSEVSTATMSSASPTESELETPRFASPYDHSSPKVHFSSSPPIEPTESLRVPVHPLNTRDDDRAMAVNLSNFSGQKFVLSTPPVKRYVQAARRPGQRGPPQVGLGFVHGTPVKAPGATDLPDIYEGDSSLDISSSSLGVSFNTSSLVASPPSLVSSRYAYNIPSKTSTTCATDGHSQSSNSSQSTWPGGHPVYARLPYLRDPNPFYDSQSGSGSGEGNSVPDAAPTVAEDGEADADTKTISEENYFDCSAEFEEDITVQSVAFAYQV